jgi:hypothetical protein
MKSFPVPAAFRAPALFLEPGGIGTAAALRHLLSMGSRALRLLFPAVLDILGRAAASCLPCVIHLFRLLEVIMIGFQLTRIFLYILKEILRLRDMLLNVIIRLTIWESQ